MIVIAERERESDGFVAVVESLKCTNIHQALRAGVRAFCKKHPIRQGDLLDVFIFENPYSEEFDFRVDFHQFRIKLGAVPIEYLPTERNEEKW